MLNSTPSNDGSPPRTPHSDTGRAARTPTARGTTGPDCPPDRSTVERHPSHPPRRLAPRPTETRPNHRQPLRNIRRTQPSGNRSPARTAGRSGRAIVTGMRDHDRGVAELRRSVADRQGPAWLKPVRARLKSNRPTWFRERDGRRRRGAPSSDGGFPGEGEGLTTPGE